MSTNACYKVRDGKAFFHKGENKENLIPAIADYVQSKEGRSKLRCPVVITSKELTYQITNRSSEVLFHCNHKEADSRLILHAILANQDVVVVAKDTDVLVLLVWAYEKCAVTHQWFMKYERDSFADVGKICRFIGRQLCLSLPAFHSISGCDTTSYMFKTRKVRIFKKLLKDQSPSTMLDALQNDEPLLENDIQKLKEFVCAVIYKGSKDEGYIDTRVRLYQQQKEKSSMALPPDPDSLLQALKRSQLQTKIWLQCGEYRMELLDPEDYGWKWNEETSAITPVWFTGTQLPPSLQKKKHRQKGYKSDQAAIEEDDDDLSDSPVTNKPRRIKRKNNPKANSSSNTDQDKGIPLENDRDFGDDEMAAEIEDCSLDSNESEWEVSDFLSSNDSVDEWAP
eukprot:gene1365-biopygen1116